MLVELYLNFSIYNLNRSRDVFPVKCRPQRRVPLNDLLPGPLKMCDIGITLNPRHVLADVRICLVGIKGMKKHPLLHRGELIDAFDVLLIHLYYLSSWLLIEAINVSRSC